MKPLYRLFLVIAAVFLLRLPSFWEPYWYGDEGIYLALGQAMQRGAVLYRDIWDNKPPLLYLLYAIHPTLLFAKITATLFVLGTVFICYKLSKSHLAALLIGILLSIPLLEGTIANAELYFTLPIALGAYLIMKQKSPILIGLLASAAFLFKVPAVFDFAGLFLALLFFQKDLKKSIWFFIPIIVITFITFVIVTSYFYLNHALSDFLIASFAQNASYVAVDTGPLSKLSNPLFTKGLLLLFSSLILIILFLKKRLSKELLFFSLWFSFSLYGALLSGRPYMHYLLQIVPPAILLFFLLLKNLRRYWYILITFFLTIFVLIRLFTGAFALDTRYYYQHWFNYISERISWEDYINGFDSRTLNSYAVANYLKENTNPTDPIFVWGDAAFVYVLSNRPPATKFIQAHHLTTIDPKNYDYIISRLERLQPKYILISRPVHFPFPALESLVAKSYRLVATFQDLYVYQLPSK